MRKLFTLVVFLSAFTTLHAQVKHAGKSSVHKKHYHHTVRAAKTQMPKIDTTIALKVVDTINNTFTAEHLLKVLAKELGKPYKYGSCGPTGFDCSGLINYAFSFLGVQLPRTSTDLGHIGEKIAFDELRPGDLLFFSGRHQTSKSKHIGHVGCVYKVEGDKVLMIHSSDEGVNILDLKDSKYYMDRLITARRIFSADSCSKSTNKSNG